MVIIIGRKVSAKGLFGGNGNELRVNDYHEDGQRAWTGVAGVEVYSKEVRKARMIIMGYAKTDERL